MHVPTMTDSTIQQAVLSELLWDPSVDETQIDDGRVTLTGPVRTWTDRRAIIGATKYTPGVREVVDQLRLDPNA
ncbi:MAG: BON domain-containing protein [Chloroflexi bacterium]|nr:BON domain-containing protein [Chloroflexota bacterium]